MKAPLFAVAARVVRQSRCIAYVSYLLKFASVVGLLVGGPGDLGVMQVVVALCDKWLVGWLRSALCEREGCGWRIRKRT